MKVSIVSGTGTVGTQVVQRLLAQGGEPRVLTRAADKIQMLPTNVWGVVGDLAQRETLSSAFEGIERLVLISPLSESEAEQGRNAIEAAREAGVGRIVFMSVHAVESCPEAPHFASKIEIQKSLEDSGVPWVTIMPNNFFQNDAWFQQPLQELGSYPQPIGGVGLSRVDVRDIADALSRAVSDDGHEGQRYPLVGADVLTGTRVAELWAEHLGRDVRYAGDDLDVWAEQAKQMMPEWMVADMKIMYAHFQKQGLVATEEDLARQSKILGRPPRSFESYVKETAVGWTAE